MYVQTGPPSRVSSREELIYGLSVVAPVLADALVAVAPDGSICYVAPALREMLGLTPGAILELSAQHELSDRAEVQRLLIECQPDSYPACPRVVRVTHTNGSHRFLEVMATPVVSHTGELLAKVLMLRDATIRVELEQRLVEKSDRIRQLLTRLPVAVYVLNNAGVLLFANADLERLIGVSHGSLVGSEPHSFVLPEDRHLVRWKRAERADGREPAVDIRMSDASGRVHWVRSTSQEILWDGVPALAVVCLDITELKAHDQHMASVLHDEVLQKAVATRLRLGTITPVGSSTPGAVDPLSAEIAEELLLQLIETTSTLLHDLEARAAPLKKNTTPLPGGTHSGSVPMYDPGPSTS